MEKLIEKKAELDKILIKDCIDYCTKHLNESSFMSFDDVFGFCMITINNKDEVFPSINIIIQSLGELKVSMDVHFGDFQIFQSTIQEDSELYKLAVEEYSKKKNKLR